MNSSEEEEAKLKNIQESGPPERRVTIRVEGI